MTVILVWELYTCSEAHIRGIRSENTGVHYKVYYIYSQELGEDDLANRIGGYVKYREPTHGKIRAGKWRAF